jgi:large subunit ribosomal protein L15
MKLHELTNTPGAIHRRKRLGRGMSSGLGKTCGKGHKGQMARKGHKHKIGFEGGQIPLIRRVPKRGFTNPTRKVFAPVNLDDLSLFDEGTEVTIELLKANGFANGHFDGIKILAKGTLDKKLTVKADAFSKSAREKIEAAGGVCEVAGK